MFVPTKHNLGKRYWRNSKFLVQICLSMCSPKPPYKEFLSLKMSRKLEFHLHISACTPSLYVIFNILFMLRIPASCPETIGFHLLWKHLSGNSILAYENLERLVADSWNTEPKCQIWPLKWKLCCVVIRHREVALPLYSQASSVHALC